MTSGNEKIGVLAPWVVAVPAPASEGGGHYLLGPRLSLVHVSSAELGPLDIDDEARALLMQEGFLIDEERAHDAPASEPPAGRPAPACFIVAPDCFSEGSALAARLRAIDPAQSWSVVRSVPEPPLGTRGRLLLLGYTEQLRPAQVLAPLLQHWDIVWVGEAKEGAYFGPIFRSIEDIEAYVRASLEWSSMRVLEELGFREMASSIVPSIRRDPTRVAHALAALDRAPKHACVLVEDASVVLPWTALLEAPVDHATLLRTQRWSKGMLRDYKTETSKDVPSVHFGSCNSPCGADEFLEGNFGKGSSVAEAETTTIGEAVERFGAYVSSTIRLPEPGKTITKRWPIEAFHPFGPAWDVYLERGKPPLRETEVEDEVSRSRVAVPAVLVQVPYRPESGEFVPTASASAGLAAFTSRSGAVLRGALEILERDNFYPAFLHQVPGERIDVASLPPTGRHGELRSLLAQLAARNFEAWLIRFPGTGAVPIVHALIWDEATTTMSRGSGSGCTWSTAALKATLEALQLRLQFELVREQGAITEIDPGYVEWARPEVCQEIRSYLKRFPAASSEFPEYADDAALLRHILATVPALLVADFFCPVAGWSAVHVLIPGAACHGVASESAGGRKLLGACFRHPIPI